MIGRAFKIVAINLAVFLLVLVVLEAGLQMIALGFPSYDVLFLQPDRVLGWKQVPNHHWTWAGADWYASDFSVNVETNALGFRDIDREVAKLRGVKRVALLGDSFIEAVQVPFKKTAGQLLERDLVSSSVHSRKWEVLNFGISNYGIGQYLLTWEEYARHFRPDYVAIFVARFHMRRTIRKEEYGAFSASRDSQLWVRPTFRVENDELIREPARDFDKFVEVQERLLKAEFAGQRSRRKQTLITSHYAREFTSRMAGLVRRSESRPKADANAEADLLS